jgi:hypothetical protein
MMVLDGQQRLQSLYLAAEGTYDGRQLYFDVTSGPERPDPDMTDGTGRNYRSAFWKHDDTNRPKRFVRVGEILAWAPRNEGREIQRVVGEIGLEADDADLAGRNIRLLRQIFNQSDLVPVETIDDEVADKSQARTLDEVLEIFVRVNSGGTRLTRSDLMFSLIKTKWGAAREAFDALLGQVNQGGPTGVDKDFVIRGLLTVADKPPSYDVANVERHWGAMSEYFETYSAALRAAIDFCRDPDVGLLSASLLTPVPTLHPIVYYLSRRTNGSVPDSQRKALRTLLYFLLFNEFVNSDARVRYLREVFQSHPGDGVPLDELLKVLEKRQRTRAITTSADMLQWNPRLTLNIVQPGVARKTLSWQSTPEVDHIFPQSVFRSKYGDLVDDIGNFAYLGKLRNIRKSDQGPAVYFKDTSDADLREQFLIEERALLAEDQFEKFVTTRRALIVERVKAFLGR